MHLYFLVARINNKYLRCRWISNQTYAERLLLLQIDKNPQKQNIKKNRRSTDSEMWMDFDLPSIDFHFFFNLINFLLNKNNVSSLRNHYNYWFSFRLLSDSFDQMTQPNYLGIEPSTLYPNAHSTIVLMLHSAHYKRLWKRYEFKYGPRRCAHEENVRPISKR